MLTVYGRATSSNVQPVMWTIAELGLTAKRLDYGHVFGGLDTPEYLAMNPHGRIPVLVDGEDAPIWESYAIVRYLAARYGRGTLWLEDPAKRAQVEMWADWAKLALSSHFTMGVFWPVIRTPPGERDEAALARALEGTFDAMAKAEARLNAAPWMSGAEFGIADIIFGHLLYRYYTIEIDRPDLPALAAYYATLQTRPAFVEHVMVSYESLRPR